MNMESFHCDACILCTSITGNMMRAGWSGGFRCVGPGFTWQWFLRFAAGLVYGVAACQFDPWLSTWRFIWSARWSLRLKHRSQWRHLKGFAPVCLRKCLVNSSDLANLHTHPSQEHLYGFSPETRISQLLDLLLHGINYTIVLISSKYIKYL